MKVEKGSGQRCRRCPTSEGSPVLLGINFSLLVTAEMKTRFDLVDRSANHNFLDGKKFMFHVGGESV